MGRFTTKELSKTTWPVYQSFFSQGHGWDHCGCTAYQGFRAPREVRKWVDQRDWNLQVKCDLVEQGRAHGILVYSESEPVGWCQFGLKEELPIRDDRQTSKLRLTESEERVWKITCFCTHRDFRKQGVARTALHAALAAIRKRGGGLVEAYPVAVVRGDSETDEQLARIKCWEKTRKQLIQAHGGCSEEVRQHLLTREVVTVFIEGVGNVNAWYASYQLYHGGTVAMFEREGFKAVAVLLDSTRLRTPGPRPSRVVMQRTV